MPVSSTPHRLLVTLSVHLPSFFSVLLAPPPSFICPGHDLPGSLSSSPLAWLLGRQGSATSRLGSERGTMPHSQIRVEEGLLEDPGKAADFQVGELKPERAHALSHTAGTPMPLLQALPLCDSVQFSSVTQSCPTLCNPKNRSMPGLHVHHQLSEFTQTHVH